MIRDACSRTEELLNSLRTAGLSSTERVHLAACADCSAAILAEETLTGLAGALGAEAPFPPVALIRFRARARARRELAERSLRPIAAWRVLASLLAAGASLVALVSSGSFFAGLTSGAVASRPTGEPLLACLLLGLLALPYWAWRRTARD